MARLKTYPVLPLLNTCVYPDISVPLIVGRPASLAALKAAQERKRDRQLVVLSQKDPKVKRPEQKDLYEIGTLVSIRRFDRVENGVHVLVRGVSRVAIRKLASDQGYLVAQISPLENPEDTSVEADALVRANQSLAKEIALLMDPENGLQGYEQLIGSIGDSLVQAYRMASLASIDLPEQQQLLEMDSFQDILKTVHKIMLRERHIVQVRIEIADKTKGDMEQQQREAVLRHQKRAIENALGERGSENEEVSELLKQIRSIDDLPKNVEEEALRELRRMEGMSPNTADFQVARSYVEFIAELPWGKQTEDRFDLRVASQILDKEHFGLEEVKERILEHLAVLQMNPNAKAPILCFVGPPGVGKTSLGRSIASTLGRKFERISLGGLHDEAELRGHRRTYVGAMPGRILQAIRRSQSTNPLLMLDEIDKLGRDFRGDPASAFMEILDPVQNANFRDNYLNLPFDLSKVFFITTANTLDTVPVALRDRMEVIELSGYADYEKQAIAKRFLIPRQRKEAGLPEPSFRITDAALRKIITHYSREAGVRGLERTLASAARKQARLVLEGKKPGSIGANNLERLIGPRKFFSEKLRRTPRPGVVAGLCWTVAGGDVLYIEAVLAHKKEALQLTGQLGDVMKESAYTARSYLWSIAPKLKIGREVIENNGVHIHVPAGSIPKDGPSAGVTIATALASVYSGHPPLKGLVMTGEISLAGLILPVGGIKEKVLAAHRVGLKEVLLPKANEHDLSSVPERIRQDMKFILVDNLMDLLRHAIPAVFPASRQTWDCEQRPQG